MLSFPDDYYIIAHFFRFVNPFFEIFSKKFLGLVFGCIQAEKGGGGYRSILLFDLIF